MKLSKRRILFFAYDGVGLGHLMRLLKIAKSLSDDFDVLVVTGHQAVGDLIPNGIEFIRLPRFSDNYSDDNATSFWRKLNVKKFRNNALWYAIKLFKPDAFITDFLPVGKKDELKDMIINYPCLKYFILRSNIGSEHIIANDIFTPDNIEILERYYQRIFIASEEGLNDFAYHPAVKGSLQNKINYVGYVVENIGNDIVENVRHERGLKLNDQWIVCSAGGGGLGEKLIEKCLSITKASRFSSNYFDVVSGYYGDFSWPYNLYDVVSITPNITLSRKTKYLPYMHAAADVVICSGGYNSLLEAVQGRSKHILAFPVQTKSTEQIQNINDLKNYYPIQEITNLEFLDEMLKNCLVTKESDNLQIDKKINMNGIDGICQIIKTDLLNDSYL